MKIIKDVICRIKDEIMDAEKCAKMATRWKEDDRALADDMVKMARCKLDNVTVLHSHAVRIIKNRNVNGKDTPPEMQAVWDYEHENQIEWIARINVLLDLYQKY